jgi:hypothetical protein
MRNSFPSQIYFGPPRIVWVACHIYQAPAQLTAQKQTQQLRQPFVPSKETNESQKHVGTVDTRKLRGNATVRRLAYSVAWEFSFTVLRELRCNCVVVSSICAASFRSTCSTQSANNSRKLRLPVSLVCPRPYCTAFLYANKSIPYFVVVVGLALSYDPESYAGGSVTTGSISHAGQVKGDPHKKVLQAVAVGG